VTSGFGEPWVGKVVLADFLGVPELSNAPWRQVSNSQVLAPLVGGVHEGTIRGPVGREDIFLDQLGK
jgi:hypothetical protein